ncbi:MAG: lipid A export permease/ATP-binding protein MsbA [Pseudohongiellaceae bacterium]
MQPLTEKQSSRRSKRSRAKGESWLLYKRLLSYIRPHLSVFQLSVLGYMIFASTSVATAWWLGWTIDAIESENYADWRILSPVLCVLIVLVRGIGGFLGAYSISHVSNHVVHKLRCEIIEHLMTLPVIYFDRSTGGKLVSKVTYDVAQITGAATNALTVILREGLTVIGLMAALLWTDWKLSLTFLLIAPVVARTVFYASKKFRKYSAQMQDSMGEVTQITNESIKGHRVVRTFNATDFVTGRFARISEKNRRQNMKMVITQTLSTPFIQLLVSIAMAVLIWFAMSPTFSEDKTAGDFVAFLTLAGFLAKPIRQLSQVNSVIQRGLSAADSIFTLLDEKPEANRGTLIVSRAKGAVEFRQVEFAYGDSTPAVRNISFKIEPGRSVALVGKSGSGKSTLVSLIPRFYDCNRGAILLDDTDIRDYDLNNLRQQIALVNQQVVLFEGTIAENIAYGSGIDVNRDSIEAAARAAHAMEFIERMPDGLDSQVGDDAGLLSGGQRQRIAIARALLKDAPILILDEATSALDSESEMYIQQALSTLVRDRTTFVIAHRLSTVENADLILVMDSGHIVESGTHQELMSLNKCYAKLHKMQFAENSQAQME